MSITEKPNTKQQRSDTKKSSKTFTNNNHCKTHSDYEHECIDEMASDGYPFSGQFIADGKIHRYSAENASEDKDEWYIAYKGISIKGYEYLNCAFGTWSGGMTKFTYNSYNKDDTLSQTDRTQLEEEWKKQQANLEEDLKKDEEQRVKWAIEAWEKAKNTPYNDEHRAYLQRKKCRAVGVKYSYAKFRGEKEPTEPAIAIDLRDINGNIKAIQRIRADGKKKISGPKFGNFHQRGEINENTVILVGEGLATVDSLLQAAISLGIDCTGIVAADCGNLLSVTGNLRKKYPKNKIIICYDDDKETQFKKNGKTYKNPGKKHAEWTAGKYNCILIGPKFSHDKDHDQDTGKLFTDFNDLHVSEGLDKVMEQLKEVLDKPLEQKSKQPHSGDEEEILEEANDTEVMVKARASARRRALMQQMPKEEIVMAICKQHPQTKENANVIAEHAIEWAERYKPGLQVTYNGIPKKITDMQSLDARFAQLEAPGNPCVTINRLDAQPIATSDFNKRLSGEVVIVGVTENGQPKFVAASTFWSGNAKKRIYNNIVFTNKPVSDDTYNLFTGFGVKPKEGKCDKILAHINEVICASDETNYKAFLDLLAWQVQNVGRPSRIIVSLKSKEHQIGKGSLLADVLPPIWGNAGFTTGEISQILSRFNDTLRGKGYIFLDEALFAGDPKSADALKSLATATRYGIETKGVPTVQFPIAINLFLTTNHENAALIEEADARYWVLEASSHRFKDTAYFSALYEEIDGSGKESFLYFLLSRDVKHFVPTRDVPLDNKFKDEMIRNSINPFDARRWIEACCHAQMILGYRPRDESSKFPWEPWIKGIEYDNGIFSTAYTEWQKTVKSPIAPKPTALNNFGKLLNDAGFVLRIDGQRWRKLPDPEVCLKLVQNMIEKTKK